jgi:DNA-binding transcriptional MerR regulator
MTAPGWDEFYTPAETAKRFGVGVRRLWAWEAAGNFPQGTVVRTPGGHRRYRAVLIDQLVNGYAPGRDRP